MGDVYMVNGKILSGLPNHAKDIIFDNYGTTLSSTNSEDAIKEVNSNLTNKIIAEAITVTTDSNGTFSATLPTTLSGYTVINIIHYNVQNYVVLFTSQSGDTLTGYIKNWDFTPIANLTTYVTVFAFKP